MVFQLSFITVGKTGLGAFLSVLGRAVNIVLAGFSWAFLELSGVTIAAGIGYAVPQLVWIVWFYVNRKVFADRPTEMAAEDHSGQLHQRLFGDGQHTGLLRWNWVLGWCGFPEHHLVCTGVVRQIVPGIYQRRFTGGQLQFWTGRQAATLPAVPDQCGDLNRDRRSCDSSQLFLGGAVVHFCKGQYSCGKNRPSWFPNRCDQLFDDGDQCVYFRMVHTLSDGRTSVILSAAPFFSWSCRRW